MCGVWLNRGRMINTFMIIPIGTLLLCTDRMLVGIGQPAEIAKFAGRYTCLAIPAAWAIGQFDATKRFSASQLKPKFPLYAQLVATTVHIMSCYLFIWKLGWGVEGAALAINITYFLNMLVLDMLIYNSP